MSDSDEAVMPERQEKNKAGQESIETFEHYSPRRCTQKNSTVQKKEYFGVLILVFTPSQISHHSLRRNPVMENSTERLLSFILLTFGEVQKDVGSAV